MPSQTSSPAPSTTQRWMPALLGGGCLIAVVWAASVGSAGGSASIATVLYLIFTASIFPLLYLLGAIGFGIPLQLFLAPDANRIWAIRTGLGLAAMLTLTHLLGMSGLLFLRPIAFAVPIIGAALLAHRLTKNKAELQRVSPSLPWLGAMPAIGVLFAAACSPPGWLWATEFGGYDVLSYHLQLPSEWIAMGKVWPVEHNVYSFLPEYMESAFTHVGVALGAGTKHAGMVTGGVLISCQLLHAWITIIAAMLTASACSAMCKHTGISDKLSAIGGAIAGATVIAAPWSVVTGSMAYNEMGVVAFFAAAVVVVFEHTLKPARRGLLAGILVGAACGCKPTALLFIAPAIGLALVWTSPRRLWLALAWTACLGGLLMLAPWLTRNALAGGNPVFPQLPGVFGAAHWSAEQAQRYTAAHSFDGSFSDALRLLVMPDPSDPASSQNAHVHRGLMHRQWSLLLPMTALALIVLGARQRTRKLVIPFAAVLLLQLLAWLTLTHVQSRFLIPMLVPMSCAIAVAIVSLGGQFKTKVIATTGCIAALIPAVSTSLVFTSEATIAGGPNAATVFGTSQFTAPPAKFDSPRDLHAVQFTNSQLPKNSMILLVGNATPLYITRDLIYTTTWDTSPIAKLMNEYPGDPARWTDGLADMGITHVFVDLGELSRLQRSGWADPLLKPQAISDWLATAAVPIYRSKHAPHLIFELP